MSAADQRNPPSPTPLSPLRLTPTSPCSDPASRGWEAKRPGLPRPHGGARYEIVRSHGRILVETALWERSILASPFEALSRHPGGIVVGIGESLDIPAHVQQILVVELFPGEEAHISLGVDYRTSEGKIEPFTPREFLHELMRTGFIVQGRNV